MTHRQDGYLAGKRDGMLRAAEIADGHKGSAKASRCAKSGLASVGDEEVYAEERGEDIAAKIIGDAIRTEANAPAEAADDMRRTAKELRDNATTCREIEEAVFWEDKAAEQESPACSGISQEHSSRASSSASASETTTPIGDPTPERRLSGEDEARVLTNLKARLDQATQLGCSALFSIVEGRAIERALSSALTSRQALAQSQGAASKGAEG